MLRHFVILVISVASDQRNGGWGGAEQQHKTRELIKQTHRLIKVVLVLGAEGYTGHRCNFCMYSRAMYVFVDRICQVRSYI